ncbi:hypothetical protein [Anatilimnocola floriformis]|uniref:hypothetical protein n=1 Tax=Anatilimnocola floriformis TaxID=2948575 RepID=UPI0020C2E8FA|nr:hypothetical protein [Anatilimnocola floriformis]
MAALTMAVFAGQFAQQFGVKHVSNLAFVVAAGAILFGLFGCLIFQWILAVVRIFFAPARRRR